MSRRAARELGFLRQGVARVRVTILDSRAAAPPGAPAGALFVQVGAFANEANANRLRAKLPHNARFGISTAATAWGGAPPRARRPLAVAREALDLLSALRAAGYRDALLVRD